MDIEANALDNPTEIWVIVCKDIDTNETYIFRTPTQKIEEAKRFKEFWNKVTVCIGHNILGYDLPVLGSLLGISYSPSYPSSIDTLIVSRLSNYPRGMARILGGEGKSHSLESYGDDFKLPKLEFSDFSQYSQEMEEYCVRDVEINHIVYNHYHTYLEDVSQHVALNTEQEFQLACNDLRSNGFRFDAPRCRQYLAFVEAELGILDEEIKKFPPKFSPIRVVTPRLTKFGTISQTSIPKTLRGQTHQMVADAPFTYGEWREFNPNSVKQQVELLWQAGWKPIDKTKTHQHNRDLTKADKLAIFGYKINENNLNTLPKSAPPAVKTLAKRILYESRRRTLTEWLSLVDASDSRIHGKFQGIGAWSHRMAHQAPNMANIPNEHSMSVDIDGKPIKRLLGGEMRSLFVAGRNRLLIGTDAKGIQLRIFAHYINDPEFTQEVVNGDPHSLNRNVMGNICKTRAASKRFIFAMLLGAGLGKLAEILECSRGEAELALARIMERYTGFATFKEARIPHDAELGYFVGLDGRKVRIPGDTVSKRRHLAMSGYLQNGEAVVMKKATLKWLKELGGDLSKDKFPYYSSPIFKLVNLVHDEWQTECVNNKDIALTIGQAQHQALVEVGEELKLNCPLAGSYWSDDRKDYTIGTNWRTTH